MASASFESTMASHFECPVCFEHALPPILQCPKGHLICAPCRQKLKQKVCPICRCSLEGVEVRNLALERIAEDLMFPCKYKCGANIRWNLKAEHEDACTLKKYSCPLPQCQFEGPYDAICVHFKVDHGLMCEFDDRMDCLIGGRGGVRRLTELQSVLEEEKFYGQLMFCHNHNFLVILRRNDTQGTALYGYEYQGTVLLIGPPEKAEHFIYRMEMGKGDTRSTWISTTQKVNKSAAEAFLQGDCFFVHPKTALLLGKKQAEIINITVSIERKEAAVEDFNDSDEDENSPSDYEYPMEDFEGHE